MLYNCCLIAVINSGARENLGDLGTGENFPVFTGEIGTGVHRRTLTTMHL